MQAMPALSIKDLEPRHERRLALALIVLALLAMAWSVWRYAPAWLAPAPGKEVRTGPGTAAAPSTDPSRSLADYALFGAAPTGRDASPAALVIEAPETDLDLTLRGTLAAEQPDQALAIVADGEGIQRNYRVGDELPGGATLHRVYRDRVILRRGGELETLKLRDPERLAGEPGAGDQPSSRTGSAAGERQAGAGEPGTTARQLRSDPAQLMRHVTAVPVQEGGRMVGVRLRSTDGGALLSRAGLRSSDVVTSVNGIPVNDMSRTGEIISQLQTADGFQVTVLRNGREQQISVSLGQ